MPEDYVNTKHNTLQLVLNKPTTMNSGNIKRLFFTSFKINKNHSGPQGQRSLTKPMEKERTCRAKSKKATKNLELCLKLSFNKLSIGKFSFHKYFIQPKL